MLQFQWPLRHSEGTCHRVRQKQATPPASAGQLGWCHVTHQHVRLANAAPRFCAVFEFVLGEPSSISTSPWPNSMKVCPLHERRRSPKVATSSKVIVTVSSGRAVLQTALCHRAAMHEPWICKRINLAQRDAARSRPDLCMMAERRSPPSFLLSSL